MKKLQIYDPCFSIFLLFMTDDRQQPRNSSLFTCLRRKCLLWLFGGYFQLPSPYMSSKHHSSTSTYLVSCLLVYSKFIIQTCVMVYISNNCIYIVHYLPLCCEWIWSQFALLFYFITFPCDCIELHNFTESQICTWAT